MRPSRSAAAISLPKYAPTIAAWKLHSNSWSYSSGVICARASCNCVSAMPCVWLTGWKSAKASGLPASARRLVASYTCQNALRPFGVPIHTHQPGRPSRFNAGSNTSVNRLGGICATSSSTTPSRVMPRSRSGLSAP